LSGFDKKSSCIISYNDWVDNYKYYVFDVSRITERLGDSGVELSLVGEIAGNQLAGVSNAVPRTTADKYPNYDLSLLSSDVPSPSDAIPMDINIIVYYESEMSLNLREKTIEVKTQ